MDFCHLIVTCLFSMLRLPFDNQKVKGNYAIFKSKVEADLRSIRQVIGRQSKVLNGVLYRKSCHPRNGRYAGRGLPRWS